MNMKAILKVFVYCALLVLILSFSPFAFAASTLAVSSSGNGGFVLQGIGMENVAALDITITYDASTLSNPQVIQGGLISGAMMEVNTQVPGAVRFGIIRLSPIKGTGIIATLVFEQVGDSPGKIIAIKARIADSSGKSLAVLAQIVNPPDGPVTASNNPPEQGTQQGTAVLPAPTTPGVIQQGVIGGGMAPSGGSAVTEKKNRYRLRKRCLSR